MSRHRAISSAATALAALTLVAGPALAANGVSVSQESTGLAFDIDFDQANITFSYNENGGRSNNVPSYEIVAVAGQAPVPLLSLGPCQVNQAGDGLECPAAQILSLDFRFRQSGFWSGYNGGGNHASPCAPAGVTVETGPGKVVEINTWDGCPETVICSTARGSLIIVEADASDEVRGPCSSIQRH
jgi:hypothetical protein